MFSMKIFYYVAALFLILYSIAETQALPSDFGRDTLTILLKFPQKNLDKLYPGNIAACFESHLDYWIWERGLKCNILEVEKEPKWDKMPDGSPAPFSRYIMYIEVKPKFTLVKADKSESRAKDGRQPHINLELKIKLSLLDRSAGHLLIDHEQFQDASLPRMIADSVVPDSLQLPEPPDFVVKRIISRALGILPRLPRDEREPAKVIPIRLMVDSHIYNDIEHGGDSAMVAALEYASYRFNRQFGIGLKVAAKNFFTIPDVSFGDIESLFRSFSRQFPSQGDTLTVGVFRPKSPLEFYMQGQTQQIGSSELGRRVALVAQLEMPDTSLPEWDIFLNSQLMLHEIGHLLGAVHVSDIKSIMVRRTTWVGSFDFDKLNGVMIKATLDDTPRYTGVKDYLALLTGTIDSTGYLLADYPSIYFSYVNLNRKELAGAVFGNSPFARSIPYAVDGYRQYLLRNSKDAFEFFRLALNGAADQGAIHYYLARVSDGKESRRELKRAAKIGYFDAVYDLISFWK
ncbi:hypothetical protein TRIP_C90318 [Candidatus Zixiibacteriota bacterium]|nr:hypothetical protein TRIP_C90318 [candidate division Zixibacteria bacterium]